MTDEQAIAAYTALYLEYPVLWEAACEAAIAVGAAKPRGASERAQAGMLAYQNRGYFCKRRWHSPGFTRPRRSRPGSGPPRTCGARRETTTRAPCWPPTAGSRPATA